MILLCSPSAPSGCMVSEVPEVKLSQATAAQVDEILDKKLHMLRSDAALVLHSLQSRAGCVETAMKLLHRIR